MTLPAPARTHRPSMLARPAWQRVLWLVPVLVLLWLAVLWACPEVVLQ